MVEWSNYYANMKLLDTLIFFSLSIRTAIDQKLMVAFVCHLLTEIISQNNSNQSYGRMFLSKANLTIKSTVNTLQQNVNFSLNPLRPNFTFNTPRKHQESRAIMMSLGGIEREL